MRRSFPPVGIVLVVLLLGLSGSLLAKPMAAPSIEEGARFSRRVVLAEYVDYKAPEKVTYFGSVTARYRVLETLKGDATPGEVAVSFTFSDGSACMEPIGADGKPEFRFSPSQMPAPGSRWILLLLEPPRPVDRRELAHSVGRPATSGRPGGNLTTAEVEALAVSMESSATSTYRGPSGRLEATPENLQKVKAALTDAGGGPKQ
ncbi:MAG: hypothetical protein HY303_12015 [Candidatus Wallbacteria bacterium]|nr:hypothetical protein [Candidatus Wallbacteria bacterium]